MRDSPTLIKALLEQALEIPSPKVREEFLERACGGDDELLGKITGLLDAYHQAGGFLEPTASFMMPPIPETEFAGEQIGPYTLREQIGEGGFGVVYAAEQREPISRSVAIKLIKPGMDSKKIISRFQAERQTLALMDHPNIARIIDAGTTTGGRPYFVMELVDGLPVTKFCNREKLSTRERLKLFVEFCRAVQHAHQKAIIHRDIKPSNLLVSRGDTTTVVKVIDFGIAKALGQALSDNTVFTAQGDIIGTPTYMSPEQADRAGLDVDTRSDIYSLGVVLYELLTDTTPFGKKQLQQAGFLELQRLLRETEPVKPSDRLSTLNNEERSKILDQGWGDIEKFGNALRGDLDWVVMKAIEKDPERRYRSAADLADDVQRYMDHRPVHAGKPSSAYRVKKFIRRHKLALAAATVLVISMIVGTGFSLWYATQAQSARVLANQSEQLAHRRLVLLQAQQEKLKAEQKKLERERSRLVEVQEQSERHYTLAREAVAKLIDEVASEKLIAFPELSELRETLLQTADQFYTELLEDNPGDHLLLIARADVRESLSQSDLAYQDYLQATEVQPNSSLTLRSFASFLRNTQDPELRDGERALQFAQRAVELSPMDAGAWLDLAWVYDHHFPGRRAEAINAFMKASELTSNQEYKAMRLGMALDRQGNHKAAIDAYTEAIEASQAKASHPFVMRGTCYFDVEEYQLAIDDFTRAVAIDAFNFVGFERRADAWIALEEYGKAAVDLEQSDSLAINRKPNQRTLLLCYLHAGQWDKAASLIENLSGNEPSHYSLIDPGLSTLIESSKTQELINARDQFLKRILLALRNEIDEIPRCLSTLTQLPQSFLDVHRHHPWFREQLVELANSMIDLTVDTTISGYAHRAWLKRSLGLDEEADKDFDLVFDRMAGRPIIPIEGVQFHTMADNENSFYEQCHVADLLSIDAWTLLNQDRYQDSIRCRVQAFDLYQRVLAEVPATPSMRRAYLDRLDWLQHSNQLVQSGAVTPPDNWNSLDIGSIDFSAAGAGAVTYGENLVQAKTLHDYGDYVHALYVHAIEEYEIALARRQDPVVTNELAWLLATCPDEDCRNLDRALELSLRTSQDAIGGFGIQSWNTHGVALYYSGCYREAIAALEKSEEFNGGQMHPMNALFLAMAHHQVGDRVRAEEYWESAEEIVGQLDAKDSDLTRFRNEARQLIFAEPAKQAVGGSAQAHSPGNAK